MFRKYNLLISLLIVSLLFMAFSPPPQVVSEPSEVPWWVWAITLLFLIWLLWWLLSGRHKEEAAPVVQAEAAAPPAEPTPPPPPPVPDDLKRIEGIGPKISAVLQEAGITTFAQLAATDVGRLEQILTDAGLTALADPTTWPEQASLAAAGKWEALETLQDELKGGRRS